MRVVWTPEAELDRAHIWDHIESPSAATLLDQRFSDAAAKLETFPMIGSTGKIPGTREFFPHENYRLVYEIQGGAVWILALVHTARQWPPVKQ